MLDKILDLYSDFFIQVQSRLIGTMDDVSKLDSFQFALNAVQILIVILSGGYIYIKFIRNTQADKLLRGILLFLIGAWIFSWGLFACKLVILGRIAQYLLTGLLFSLVIVFQPELRKLLAHIGETKFAAQGLFGLKNKGRNEECAKLADEITEAVKYCSRVKRGALIVLQKENDQSFYNDIGTVINADVSAELILTIFFPNTPLHDGAMIIHDGRISAAGVLLPLTEDPKLSWRYGTRHRAAIGASEISDSACIVVSEETGGISIAIDGILRKYEDISKLREDLETLLGKKHLEKNDNMFFKNLFKFGKKQAV